VSTFGTACVSASSAPRRDDFPSERVPADGINHGIHEYPLVSVIIACYNGAAFLEEALRSALAQSHPEMEVVVVNGWRKQYGRQLAWELARSVSTLSADHLRRKLLLLANQYPQGLLMLMLLRIHPAFSQRKFMARFRQQVQVAASNRVEDSAKEVRGLKHAQTVSK
jgi:cellulose synthase/poly-beta-1,6-N-acetylglucosamine synthase-like glycosyltransferase